ncbi:MAG: tetratricopeptide repeat protein [Bryobacteraceae bacterium]
MRTEADELREAAAHHRAGRLAEAAAGYRAVLARDPRQPDALYLLGVVAHQPGQDAQAARLFRETVAVKPDHPYCWNLLGLAPHPRDNAATKTQTARCEFCHGANIGPRNAAPG